ncbi:uncharacterized protein LOC121977944 isoform X1 [Zingiber officinale]|uniref:uncharacterized protein LOC121977944 isoform X1 n=1 Tax=Zingiber officinale TaxID=94328 RepID=UPI001C4CA379|nr:uncharacterized protein LOC121977944 isoform X1 [Zingiber officinale]
MEGILLQSQNDAKDADKTESVVLDIESLTQSSDKCSGSPKMTKALSRKGSSRMEKRNGEEQDADDATKRVSIKVACSQMEHFKQSSVPNAMSDVCDARLRKLNHLTTINPRRILLLFASLSSLGTMILIYFTLAIHHRQSHS